MASSRERQREYERRRYEKRMARMSKSEQRRARTRASWTIGVGLVVVLALTVNLLWSSAHPGASVSASASASASASTVATTAPDPSLAEGRTWTGTLTLSQGTLGISLDGAKAPQAVASFTQLAKKGFFTHTVCHRVVVNTSGGLLQCGDPNGDGTGGPGYSFGPIENAPSDGIYTSGMIAMARQSNDANSNGSQFFIVWGQMTLPNDTAGGYTVFGSVTSGLDVVQQIGAATVPNPTASGTDTKPSETVTIENVEIQ